MLPAFLSRNARRIYGIAPPPKEVVLERRPWIVPASYGGVVPFYAGRQLAWRTENPEQYSEEQYVS
jgi:dihydroorotase